MQGKSLEYTVLHVGSRGEDQVVRGEEGVTEERSGLREVKKNGKRRDRLHGPKHFGLICSQLVLSLSLSLRGFPVQLHACSCRTTQFQYICHVHLHFPCLTFKRRANKHKLPRRSTFMNRLAHRQHKIEREQVYFVCVCACVCVRVRARAYVGVGVLLFGVFFWVFFLVLFLF